jgi:hypothetical protein
MNGHSFKSPAIAFASRFDGFLRIPDGHSNPTVSG